MLEIPYCVPLLTHSSSEVSENGCKTGDGLNRRVPMKYDRLHAKFLMTTLNKRPFVL